MQLNRPTFMPALALLGGLLLCLVSPSASAQVPTQVPFQGLLLDDTSQPVTATVDFDFVLFDAVAAGASLWNESHSAVPVVDGVYSVNLGSQTPLTSGILAGGVAFLEITVDGETLAPRQQLLSVPYALRADQVGTVSAAFVEAVFEGFEFDGNEPPNLHPDEGLADVDGDGRPNFLDDDNDGDGILDGVEVANGSDINLVTPTLISPLPSTVSAFAWTTLQVRGTGLSGVSSVSFAGESVVAYAVTDTEFSVDVTTPTTTSPASLVVTLGNGENTSRDVPVEVVAPTITSFSPPFLTDSTPATIDIVGTGFFTGTTVQVGTQNLVPTAITPTTMTVDVAAEPLGALAVVANHPNGTSANGLINVVPAGSPRIVFVTGSSLDGDFTAAGADALCQSQAGIGGLLGNLQGGRSDEGVADLGVRARPADAISTPTVPSRGGRGPGAGGGGGAKCRPPPRAGTNSDGTAKPTTASTCSEWTVNSGGGSVGFATRTDGGWSASYGCLSFARLYCVQQ